jgi:pilus assembly protein CpaB
MRFDRRFAIVVGCSLLWALLVASLFYRVAAKSGTGNAPVREKPLIVAAQALPFGALIGHESIKTIQVPEALFPKGGSTHAEEVLGRSVVSPIEMDEPVLEARIAPKGSGVGLAPMIPPGLRAIAVKVNEVVGVAGFVLPGMRVDVLVTGRPPGLNDTATATVLQNIPVLSAGQSIQVDTKGQPISATVVTLLVSPAQAEALTLANNEGHIQLVLRNNSDQEVTRTSGRQTRELYGSEPHATSAPMVPELDPPLRPRKVAAAPVIQTAPPVQAPRPPVPHPDDVIMIRGNLKTVEPALPKTNN